MGRRRNEKNRLEDITRGRISEVIGNIRLVRGFMAQAPEWKLVSKTLAKVNQIYDRQSTTYHLINFFREFSLELVLILISLITFNQTFKGQLSLGEMVLILQLINLLRRPLFAMSFILERIQAAESGSKEYFTIMDLKEEEKLNLLALPKSKLISRPSLHFDQVSFRYDTTGNEVLKKYPLRFLPAKL